MSSILPVAGLGHSEVVVVLRRQMPTRPVVHLSRLQGGSIATMTAGSRWGITPRQSIERECSARGRSAVIDGCVRLLGGDTDVDPILIYALGGPSAQWALSGGEAGRDYWLRVWAARGLMWAWDDRAYPAIEKALSDPAWRVREMAVKVAARHQLGDLLQALGNLQDDPNRRVVLAAERAVARIAASDS